VRWAATAVRYRTLISPKSFEDHYRDGVVPANRPAAASQHPSSTTRERGAGRLVPGRHDEAGVDQRRHHLSAGGLPLPKQRGADRVAGEQQPAQVSRDR
jgi:hypothetical protein